MIDCEGVVGTIKRKLLNKKSRLISTYQTYNKGSIDLDYHYFYAFLQLELSEYDAWFNVKDNQLVLGVSVKEKGKAEQYYKQFISYMKKEHNLVVEKQLKIDRWLMPWIQPGCKIDYGIGRVFFVGEIDVFLNPMGEGISSGMESGHCLALAIAKNFNSQEQIYSDYMNGTESLHNYMKRQWSSVARMTDTFSEMIL